jgi:hypothetical protein
MPFIEASGCSAQNPVVPRIMPHGAAHDCALETTLGFGK